MSYLGWMSVLSIAFFAFVFFTGKRRWDVYVTLAQLRPDERILHAEKDVPIKTKSWAAFPLYDCTFAGGGPEEFHWLTADVTITNERILVIQNGVPCSIVNFTRPETLPSSWLAWREDFLMNVAKSDIQVTTDQSDKPCLEILYAPRKGHGIRKRYYLRNLEVARVQFPPAAEELIQE